MFCGCQVPDQQYHKCEEEMITCTYLHCMRRCCWMLFCVFEIRLNFNHFHQHSPPSSAFIPTLGLIFVPCISLLRFDKSGHQILNCFWSLATFSDFWIRISGAWSLRAAPFESSRVATRVRNTIIRVGSSFQFAGRFRLNSSLIQMQVPRPTYATRAIEIQDGNVAKQRREKEKESEIKQAQIVGSKLKLRWRHLPIRLAAVSAVPAAMKRSETPPSLKLIACH